MKTLVSGLKRREEITKSWLIVKLFFQIIIIIIIIIIITN